MLIILEPTHAISLTTDAIRENKKEDTTITKKPLCDRFIISKAITIVVHKFWNSFDDDRKSLKSLIQRLLGGHDIVGSKLFLQKLKSSVV